MGGIGKSVLAAALARDEAVAATYPDGIYWLKLGQKPEITRLQAELARALSTQQLVFDNPQDGKAKLTELFQGNACLLILDDIWIKEQVEAFDAMGVHGRILFTTRSSDIITALGGIKHEIDILTDHQAKALLSEWSGIAPENLPDKAESVAKECGKLPLALAVCAAMVKDGIPWEYLLKALKCTDLEFIDHPYGSVIKSLKVSIDALPEVERAAYHELAVFPEDTLIPEAAIITMWQHSRALADYRAGALITRLANRALLRYVDHPSGRRVDIHDLHHHYLRSITKHYLPQLHNTLLAAYQVKCPEGLPSGPNDGYFYEHLALHLSAAGKQDLLLTLLFDYRWLQAKLAAVDIQALILDYQSVDDADTNLIKAVLQLSAHTLSQDKSQLRSQLWGRLTGQHSLKIQQLLDQSRQEESQPWLRPLSACLTPAGSPLLFSIEGHTKPVIEVKLTRDGKRLISCSYDQTIKAWDLQTGRLLKTLNEHSEAAFEAVAVTASDNGIISGSDDQTIKLWDLNTGALLTELEVPGPSVTTIVIAGSNQIITGAGNGTLMIWDLKTGVPVATLEQYAPKNANPSLFATKKPLAITSDGERVISGSNQNTVKVWHLKRRELLATIECGYGSVYSLTVTPDDRHVIVGSILGLIKIFDLNSGELLANISGHSVISDYEYAHGNSILSLTVTPDGKQLITGSDDQTIKIWNFHTRRLLTTHKGHYGAVTSLAITPDGSRLISGSMDGTIKVWNLNYVEPRGPSQWHDCAVISVAINTENQEAVSVSKDGTVKVWNLHNGELLATHIHKQGETVMDLAITKDGKRILLALSDGTLERWDADTRTTVTVLDREQLAGRAGFIDLIYAMAVTTDGQRAITYSIIPAIKMWDLKTGALLTTLEDTNPGYKGYKLLAITPNERTVIASSPLFIHVWDLHSGRLLATHTEFESSFAVTSDSERIVYSTTDGAIKVWHIESETPERTFPGGNSRITSLSLTMDDKYVLSCYEDSTIKVWELTTGKRLTTFAGHSDIVTDLLVMPDNRYVISASHDKTIKVWDIDNGKEIASYRGEQPFLSCAVTVTDKLTIVTGDKLGRVHILRLE